MSLSIYIESFAEVVRRNDDHGVQFILGMTVIFLPLFVNDVVLISTSPVGLQNQKDYLVTALKPHSLHINLERTKVKVFRKDSHLATGERWYIDGKLWAL